MGIEPHKYHPSGFSFPSISSSIPPLVLLLLLSLQIREYRDANLSLASFQEKGRPVNGKRHSPDKLWNWTPRLHFTGKVHCSVLIHGNTISFTAYTTGQQHDSGSMQSLFTVKYLSPLSQMPANERINCSDNRNIFLPGTYQHCNPYNFNVS